MRSQRVSEVWTLLVGLCALACPLSMGAMMLMMRRRRGDSASRSEINELLRRGPRDAASGLFEEEPDCSQE